MQNIQIDLPAYGVRTEFGVPKKKLPPRWSYKFQTLMIEQCLKLDRNYQPKRSKKQKKEKSSEQIRLEAEVNYEKRCEFNEKVSEKLTQLAQSLKTLFNRIVKITDESVENVVVIKNRVADYSNQLVKTQIQTCAVCGEPLDAGTVQKDLKYVCSQCADLYDFKRGEKSLKLASRAKTIKDCGNQFVTYRCRECGTHVVGNNVYTCDDKLCAHCAHSRSIKMKERLTAIIGDYCDQHGSEKKLRMITLTVKNCQPGQLISSIKKLRESFSKLRRRKIFENVHGGFYSIEITYNSDYDTWHPHIHCIVYSDGNIDQRKLSAIWNKITKGSFVVGVSLIDTKSDSSSDDKHKHDVSLESAIGECTKYITKMTVDKQTGELPPVFNEPERFLELISAIYRLRQFHGFGVFYGIVTALDEIVDSETELEQYDLDREEFIEKIAEIQLKYNISDELVEKVLLSAMEMHSKNVKSLPQCPKCGGNEYDFAGIVSLETAKALYEKYEVLLMKARAA